MACNTHAILSEYFLGRLCFQAWGADFLLAWTIWRLGLKNQLMMGLFSNMFLYMQIPTVPIWRFTCRVVIFPWSGVVSSLSIRIIMLCYPLSHSLRLVATFSLKEIFVGFQEFCQSARRQEMVQHAKVIAKFSVITFGLFPSQSCPRDTFPLRHTFAYHQ